VTLQQHARQLLEQGHGNDGAIMCFIAALYLAEAEIEHGEKAGTGVIGAGEPE
jgi:hypothetical protein